jgi:haloacetate dehalogenase
MALAAAYFHWYFLIQPAPLPERLIGHDPRFYLEAIFGRLRSAPGIMESGVMDEYLRHFGTPEGIHASCEDYRAGATFDLANDRADVAAGRKIMCPTLILWGARSVVGTVFRPLDSWRDLIAKPHGEAFDCGHFLPEERPYETLRALGAFLAGAG